MQINLNADPEFRQMVAQEVRAALITNTQADLLAAVNEGSRRALGTAMEKIPHLITQQVRAQVQLAVTEARVTDQIRQGIRDIVREVVTEKIKTLAEQGIDPAVVERIIREKLANLKVSIVL